MKFEPARSASAPTVSGETCRAIQAGFGRVAFENHRRAADFRIVPTAGGQAIQAAIGFLFLLMFL